MKIINLGSGSRGNSTLLKIHSGYILVDCGLREFDRKLAEQNISMDEIKYLFVTHDHRDHIGNILKFNPQIIYTGAATVEVGHNRVDYFQTHDFKEFKVTILKTSHDAPQPMGFIFQIGNSEVVYMTDTGKIPAKTKRLLINRRFYIIESNYEEELLMASERPIFLKERIRSNKGHLSNLQTNIYLKEFIGDKTYGIALAHISEECNNPEKVLESLKDFSHLPITTYLKQWEPTIITYDED